MSQRTRGPMTGAGIRKPSEVVDISKRPAQSRRALSESKELAAKLTASSSASQPALDPRSIARVLRVVADEMERDPALAERVAAATRNETAAVAHAPHGHEPRMPSSKVGNRPFRARIVKGAAAELGAGIPDPFALRVRLGRDGLRAALEELRQGTLRAMVREYRLDVQGAAPQQADAARLRRLILAATEQA